MSTLPQWMLQRDPAETLRPNDRQSARRSGRSSHVRRAAGGLSRLVSHALADDECAARCGLLQAIDARFKVIGLIGLVVVTTLLHSIAGLVACYCLCVAMAVASRLPMRRFAGVWLVVPLFSAAIMLPATLNVVTEGRHLWTLFHLHSSPIAVTDAGLVAAARMVLRTATCVSLALLLTVTTARPRLFRGLRALGVPRLFVMLLGMMERYLGVVARAAEEIHLAKLSRSIEQGDLRREHAWVAAGMGSLFRRSHSLSQAIYMAMVSRGYTGEVRLLEEPRARGRDWFFAAATAACAAGLLLIG